MSYGYKEAPRPINLKVLKRMIDDGFQAIPKDDAHKEACIIIGDTGVGKSTILSYFLGYDLFTEFDGIKTRLMSKANDKKVVIGHERFSQTAVPNKIIIDDLVFYDCPGFKDNKGQQYEISNSFFVQRLLDIYKHVKIVLLIEDSHVTQTRSEKLPKLINNLVKSFQTLQDIQEGVVLVINKANRDLTLSDYESQIKKMINLKIQNKNMFNPQQANFMEYLIRNKRICLFRAPRKQQNGQKFYPSDMEKNIMPTIKNCRFVKSRHILNILSQSAKLAITEFIQEVTASSSAKIEQICALIVQKYKQKMGQTGGDVKGMIDTKSQVVKLAERLRNCKQQDIVTILQRQLTDSAKKNHGNIRDFTSDFEAILFFKNIYNKTDIYFQNLVNKAYSQLAHLLVNFDAVIIENQKKNFQVQERKVKEQKKIQIKQRTQRQRTDLNEQLRRIDDLKAQVNQISHASATIVESLNDANGYLGELEKEIQQLKRQCGQLQSIGQNVYNNFNRMEQTYMNKRYYS